MQEKVGRRELGMEGKKLCWNVLYERRINFQLKKDKEGVDSARILGKVGESHYHYSFEVLKKCYKMPKTLTLKTHVSTEYFF